MVAPELGAAAGVDAVATVCSGCGATLVQAASSAVNVARARSSCLIVVTGMVSIVHSGQTLTVLRCNAYSGAGIHQFGDYHGVAIGGMFNGRINC